MKIFLQCHTMNVLKILSQTQNLWEETYFHPMLKKTSNWGCRVRRLKEIFFFTEIEINQGKSKTSEMESSSKIKNS